VSSNKQIIIAGRYQLLLKLGEGGMGTVFKAKDRLTNQIVALKQVLRSPFDLEFTTRLISDNNLQLALAQEFRTLASLRHPNIISVLDYGFGTDHHPFFTMEYLQAPQNLREAAQGRSIEEIIDLLLQLLQSVAYLHRHHIVHRDLKPDNVVVIDGKVKTLDFGLAIIHSDSSSSFSSDLAGTYPYIAPELFEGKVATRSSDLWAIGIMAYELFAGRHPFNISNPMALMRDLLTKNPDMAGLGLSDNLTEILEKLLQKAPEDRYSDAFVVIDALAQVLGKDQLEESTELRASFIEAARFVGRESERSQLEGMLVEAINGKGHAVLIGGESGVGKSRLLDEFYNHALVKGATVLRGHGVEGGGLPFQLWRDAMRRMVLEVELSDIHMRILKEIVPDIGTLLDIEIPDMVKLDGRANIARLKLAIVNVFKQIKQPIVLIFEDLQWTTESLVPLKELTVVTHELPLLIIGSYRNDEYFDLPDELPFIEVIPLARLDEGEIVQLSQSMLGTVGRQPHLIEVLKRETDGNCFFIVEVVRALAEEAGRLVDIDRMTIPDYVVAGRIGEIVRRRLSHIPKWGQELLKLSALAGRYLDKTVIQHIAQHQLTIQLGEHSVNDWLTICADYTILELQDLKWRFVHDKLREIIVQDLSQDRRIQFHHKIAEAIETVYPANSSYNEILLEHWHQAGQLDKEIQYLIHVAKHLIHTLADYGHARELLERGIKQLTQDDPRRITLWNLQAQLELLQGNYDEAQLLAHRITKLAEPSDGYQSIIKSSMTLGIVAVSQGKYEHAQSYFLQSLNISRNIGSRENIAMCILNLANVARNLGDYEQALHQFQRCLTMFEELDKPQEIAWTFNGLGSVAFSEGFAEQAQKYFQQSLILFEEIGNRDGISWTLGNLGLVALNKKYYHQAQDYFQRSITISKEVGDQWDTIRGLNNLGFVYLSMNDNRAQESFYEALTLAEPIKAIPMYLEILVGFAWLYLLNGDSIHACELAGLSLYHPATRTDVKFKLSLFMPKLEAIVNRTDFEAALGRSKNMNLDHIVQVLLNEFKDNKASPKK
jgi:tetratricopeptide (TPR) repeat protein